MIATPDSSTSSPTSSRYAWPPPNSRGNLSRRPVLTRSNVSWNRVLVSRSILRIASSSVVSASVRSANWRSRYSLRSVCSANSSIAARLTCPRRSIFSVVSARRCSQAAHVRIGDERRDDVLQLEPGLHELLEQRLAPYLQFLHREPHVLERRPGLVDGGLGRHASLVELAQVRVDGFHRLARRRPVRPRPRLGAAVLPRARSSAGPRPPRPRRAGFRGRHAGFRTGRSAHRGARCPPAATGGSCAAIRRGSPPRARYCARPAARSRACARRRAQHFAFGLERDAAVLELGHRR